MTAQNQGNRLVAFALAARRLILQGLQAGLEDDTEVAQTIQGMILGARSETSPSLKRLFRDTGTIHLFSASGLQVGLLTGLAWSCLRSIRLPRRSFALAIVSVVIAYSAVTGFYPATVRASIRGCCRFTRQNLSLLLGNRAVRQLWATDRSPARRNKSPERRISTLVIAFTVDG